MKESLLQTKHKSAILFLLLFQVNIYETFVAGFISVVENPSIEGRNNHRYSPSTILKVSEYHVPGYAQSKVPFILTEKDLAEVSEINDINNNYDDASVMTIARPKTKVLEVQSYSSSDYESIIPYEDSHLLHKTKLAIFSQGECERIVKEAEEVASRIQWTKNRHGNYPTTDLPLVELPETLKFLKFALAERIYPLLQAQFGALLPDPTKLRVADGFVVKYDAAGGQSELKPHRDGSVLSFNIALNPATEFNGGGTWFASLNDAIKIDQGEVVSHASSILHGGHGITSGKRYILVAFVILEGYENWSMRFYNQVRNL